MLLPALRAAGLLPGAASVSAKPIIRRWCDIMSRTKLMSTRLTPGGGLGWTSGVDSVLHAERLRTSAIIVAAPARPEERTGSYRPATSSSEVASKLLSRRLLLTTNTEENAIAAP